MSIECIEHVHQRARIEFEEALQRVAAGCVRCDARTAHTARVARTRAAAEPEPGSGPEAAQTQTHAAPALCATADARSARRAALEVLDERVQRAARSQTDVDA